jgi:hypothetical protein
MTHTTLPAWKEKLFPLEERSQTDQIVLECSLQKRVDRCNFKLKDGYQGQQIDASSVVTADFQHESNTNIEPEQEAEIEVASTQLVKISDMTEHDRNHNNGFYCSECFADRESDCICERIVGYDAETGYPVVDVTEEEWVYLHNSK